MVHELHGLHELHKLHKLHKLHAEDRLAIVEAIRSATLRRHDGGWRIGRRVISPQDTPLGGAHLADAGNR